MAAKIKGITIEIGGNTQPLNKALESVNKQSKDLQSELKQVERLLKLDPKNTELLAQKQKLLADAVNNTKSKLDTLREAERQVQQQFKEGKVGEEQYRLIQREVIATEQNLKKLEEQLREVNNRWKDTAENLEKFGKKSTEIGKDLSMKVTAPIVATGAASFKMAADMQDAVGATEQIYGKAADSVKEWADNLESYYGIAEKEALEYANMMGSMLQNIGGLTEEQAAKQAQTLIELAGDLTAMYGGTTADAVRALTGALKGNNTMLDNYGMAVNDAMIKTKAFEMGIYSGKGEMDLATKQAATLALIMEQTGAAQGQAAREADGASGSMRALVTEIKNLSTDIGEVLLPVITPFIQKLKDIVGAFGELSPGTQKAIIAIAGIAAAIGPLLIIVGQMSLGLSSIIKLFGGFSTATAGATAAASGAAGATGGLSAVIGALTGPIGIAIAAIAAISAVIVHLWKTNEEFRENVKAIWEQIKELFTVAFEKIKSIIMTFYEGIKAWWEEHSATILEVLNALWNTIATIFNTALGVIRGLFDVFIGLFTGDWERMGEGVKKIFASLWEGIKNIVANAWNILKGAFSILWDSIAGWFNNLVSSAVNWGKNLISGFVDGIKSMIGKVKDAVSGVIGAVSDFLGFNSPAKKGEGRHIEKWGYNMIEGFMEGMRKALPELQMSAKAVVPVIKNEIVANTQIDYSKIPKGDIIIHVYNPQPSPAELARQIKKEQQLLALGF